MLQKKRSFLAVYSIEVTSLPNENSNYVTTCHFTGRIQIDEYRKLCLFTFFFIWYLASHFEKITTENNLNVKNFMTYNIKFFIY